MTLVLFDEILEDNHHKLWATVDGSGDLVISGHDLRPFEQRTFGDADYEWAHTVPSAYVPAFLAMLGGAPGAAALTVLEGFVGKKSYELGPIIEEAKKVMPIEFCSTHD
jgi:hypothetical protein